MDAKNEIDSNYPLRHKHSKRFTQNLERHQTLQHYRGEKINLLLYDSGADDADRFFLFSTC